MFETYLFLYFLFRIVNMLPNLCIEEGEACEIEGFELVNLEWKLHRKLFVCSC